MKNLITQRQPSTRREGVVKKLYGRLILLAVMTLMAGNAMAQVQYKHTTFDFTTINSADAIKMSGASYSANDGGKWGAAYYMDSFNGTASGQLAFRYGGASSTNYGWWFRNDGNGKGLFHSDSGKPASFAITGLRAGDKVKITCSNPQNLKYIKFADNVHALYENHSVQPEQNKYDFQEWSDSQDFSIHSDAWIDITSDGDMILRNYGWNFITKIEIYSIKNATYKITKENKYTTSFEFKTDGLMDYNDIAVPYMQVSFGAARNYVVVDGLQSRIYDWQEYEGITSQNGLPFSGNFYTFTPTGNGTVTLTGTFDNFFGGSATVNLYRETSGNHSTYTQISSFNSNNNGNTISFNVEAGYTYYLGNQSDWGQQFHLQKLTFTNTFWLEPLAVIKDSDSPNGFVTTVHGSYGLSLCKDNTMNILNDKCKLKRISENIVDNNIQVSLSGDQLSISGIGFKTGNVNKGGTVIYHLVTNQGWADFVITIPYSAAYLAEYKYGNETVATHQTEKDKYGERTWGHRWNFADPRQSDSGRNTTGILELGSKDDPTSLLYEEIQKREWNYAQRVTGQGGGFHDPMYTNVYDMEGDNADMIWETEGLWFDTESNLSCLWNEGAVPTLKGTPAEGTYQEYSTNKDPDRYIGLMPPSTEGGVSSFTIPGLKDGDRVEIFMGSGEASGTDIPYFYIEGAQDALGNDINGMYGFGGSMWDFEDGANPRYDYRSCYQFIKKGNGNMKFSLHHGSMAKLYSIRIYQGDKSYHNSVEKNNPSRDAFEFLNTYADGNVGDEGQEFWWTLHHRGKGESLMDPVVLGSLGNLDLSSSRLFRTGNNLAIGYKSKIGQFGTFRLRIKGADFTGNYVTDYADQSIPVGYLEKMQYPYTWDFTDLKTKYVDNTTGISQELSQSSMDNKLYIWQASDLGYDLYTQANGNYANVREDYVFANGGQLYAGEKMFDETRGIGIYPKSMHQRQQNGKMHLTADGLVLEAPNNYDFTLRIPKVDAGAAVYVRGKRYNKRPEIKRCKIGNKAEQDFTKVIPITNDDTAKDDGSASEFVFVVKNTESTAQDIDLRINDYVIKRIAVSTDPKKVNVKGYASESRNHAIDASLLPYFTGENMMTYTVAVDSETGEAVDYKNLTINMLNAGSSNAVADKSHVIPANTGCVIRHVVDETGGAVDDKTFDVLASGDGFHLFVPDMHDTENLVNPSFNNQFLVAAVDGMEQGVPYSNTGGFVKFDHSYDTTGAAVWYAYTWKDGENGSWVGETNGMYVGLKDYVIFVRMNPNPQAINGIVYPNPDFHNAWNKTNTLTVQKDKQFTMTGYDSNNKLENCGQYIDQVVGSWGDLPTPAVDMTNYVLTYKYKKVNPDGTLSGIISGEEKFYRVHSNWNIKLRANSAYLQLPTASVSPSGDATNAPNRAPSFRFKFDNNDYMRGDVNADQTVDVADFVATANYILGNEPESFVFKAGDLNKDADIDVSDFISVANIILGRPAQTHAMSRGANADTVDDALYVEPFEAVPGTQQVISVRMNNSVPVAGYEFNLRLPEGITVARDANGYMAELSTERTNERRTNFFGTAMQADGTLKVLCGTSNADNYGLFTFDGSEGEVARITVNIPENYKRGMSTATVTDARYTDLEGQLYFFGTTTGISDIAVTFDAEPDTYYTLSGQKLDGRPTLRGLYIVNGKKVMVK